MNIGVTYDGAWQKRGFSSLYRVWIYTGLVIDNELTSKYCQSCKNKQWVRRMLSGTVEALYRAAWAGWLHQPDRRIQGGGGQTGNISWNWSVERQRLRYTKMVSCSSASIVDLQPYGPDVSLLKLECINHAEKRLFTALRSLAKKEHLRGWKAGKLSDQKSWHSNVTIEWRH